MVNDNNFVAIQGWMTRLGLKGNELICFAVIYGFSQDGNSVFSGASSYLAEWMGVKKWTAIHVLQQLATKGLIIKTDKTINGVRVCDYKVNLAIIPELTSPNKTDSSNNDVKITPGGWCENHTGGGVKITPGGGVKITPHIYNIDNIVDNINTPYNPPRGGVNAIGDSFDEFWKAYVPVPGTDGCIVQKGDKGKARQKYAQYIKQGVKPEDILAGLKNYLADCMKNRIKSCGANVFLNQERWKREYEQTGFSVNFTELVALWNDMADRLNLPKVNESDLMPERKAEIQQIITIKQPKNLKSLMDELENIIKRSPKLLGVQEELNDDNRWYTRELGWKVSFAFCFSTRGWADIMTGKYNGESF